MKFIDIIHLGPVLETGNKIYWFYSSLITRESDELEIISRAREWLSILFLLLSNRDSSEAILGEVDNVESVTALDANNPTRNDQLL